MSAPSFAPATTFLEPRTSGLSLEKNVPVLVLFSGFPDTTTTWKDFAPHFEKDYHVVKIAMPDYERPKLRRFWGYNLTDICNELNCVIESYHKQGAKDVYLLGHDWGAVIAIKYAHRFPNSIRKFVAEDVGIINFLKDSPPFDMFRAVAYQLFCAMGFLITRLTGSFCFSLLVSLYPWQWLGPEVGDISPYIARGSPHFTYPYVHAFLDSTTFKMKFTPEVPQLFIYGRQKKFMFHSQRYLKLLEKTPGCSWICYDDSGHWIHETNAAGMAKDVKEFLSSNK